MRNGCGSLEGSLGRPSEIFRHKDGTYREVTKTWSAGNPAYLGTVMKALEDIRKVWGAESPKQVQVEAEVQVVSPQEQLTRIGQHMRQLMPEVVAEVVGGDV